MTTVQRTRDKEGYEFWTETFGTAEKADIGPFAEKLAATFRKDIDPLITYKIVDHIIGKDDGDGGEESITLEQWEAFLAKFGPFTECMTHTKASMIDREGNIQPWFHGHISRDNAAQFFLQEAGYFLVRYGSQENDRDKLVMSYARIRDEDGKRAFVTKSTYIHIDPKKGYHMSSDAETPGYWYATLPQMFVERWSGLNAVPSKLYSKFAVHTSKGQTSYTYYGDKDKKGDMPHYQKRALNKYGYTRHTGEAAVPSQPVRSATVTAPQSHYAHYTGSEAPAGGGGSGAHAAVTPTQAKPHVASAMYAAYNDQAAKQPAGSGGSAQPHTLTHQSTASSVQHVAQRIITASGHADKPTTSPAPAPHHSESNYAAYGLEDGKHAAGGHRGSGSDHSVKKDAKKDKAPIVQPSATYAAYDINAAQPPASSARSVDRVQSVPVVSTSSSVNRLAHATSGLTISGKGGAGGGGGANQPESNYQTYEEAAGPTPAARGQTFTAGTNNHAAGAAYHAYQGGGKR